MHTFRNLSQGKVFVVPENQRGFSWKPNHVDDLFHDLELAGTHTHYLGPVIVSKIEGEGYEDDELSMVQEFTLEDGQQRITSFMIIANELCLRSEELHLEPIHASELSRLVFFLKNGKKLRLQNRNPNLQQFYSYLILGEPAPPGDISAPMMAMEIVRNHVRQKVAKFEQHELIKWKNCISNKAKFIWVDLHSEQINRYLAFDAINSRGLPLSEFDKIKNFCILVAKTRGIEIQPENAWYKAILQLSKYGVASRSQEEAFIAEIYSVFHDESVNQSDVHTKFVAKYRSLLVAADENLETKISDFIRTWDKYARGFGFVSTKTRKDLYGKPEGCSLEAGKWFDRLDNMDYLTITRMILATSWLAHETLDFETTVRACEIYTFRVYAAMRYRTTKNHSNVIRLANQILKNDKSVTYIAGTICHWLGELAPLSTVVSEIGDGQPKYYFDNQTKGWPHCYYFLYEYEISQSPAGVSPLQWGVDKQKKINTQEHILPQTHRDSGWWEEHWPDEIRADKFKHRLGNLVLTANNQVLGRKRIAKKLSDPEAAHDFNRNNATNSEKTITGFTNGDEWLAGNILNREAALLKFAADRWSLGCCCDNGTFNLPDQYAEHADSNEITIMIAECYGEEENGLLQGEEHEILPDPDD